MSICTSGNTCAVYYSTIEFRWWTRTTTWMPDSATLQIHFFSVPKGIATFRTTSTCWMKMMIISGLQHLSADKTIAIRTLDPEGLLIIFFAIRNTILSHIFPIEGATTRLTPMKSKIQLLGASSKTKEHSLETPNMPLSVESNECLSFLQCLSTSRTIVRISWLWNLRLSDTFLLLLCCCGNFRTRCDTSTS